jgi:transcription antitermination protein NusB
MSINRRKIRETVMQILYAHEFSGDPIESIMPDFLQDIRKDLESYSFAKLLLETVIKNGDEIDKKIQPHVDNWEFERLAVIDKILIRIAVGEFLYFSDIPPKVTINEAIEIAKKFSTENSGKFINGILDAILTNLKTTDELNKIGRGLLNRSTNQNPL